MPVSKQRWERAISDVIDLLLKVNVLTDGMGNKKYVLDNPRLRPMAQICWILPSSASLRMAQTWPAGRASC